MLVRCRINRLSHVDRATGEPIRRYEHDHPGSLLHVDVKKLGNIPDGGGHKVHSRTGGGHNSSAHRDPDRLRKIGGRANLGYGYLHNAMDDHTRLSYTEIVPDKTRHSAATF